MFGVHEYEELALRTAKNMGSVEMNLIHSALGLASDSGEFVDAIKKHVIYGKELDFENCKEELGDILWFVVLAANSLNITLQDVMISNIEKLEKRYPNNYSDAAAIERADKVFYVLALNKEEADRGNYFSGLFKTKEEALGSSNIYGFENYLFEVKEN